MADAGAGTRGAERGTQGSRPGGRGPAGHARRAGPDGRATAAAADLPARGRTPGGMCQRGPGPGRAAARVAAPAPGYRFNIPNSL